MNPKSLLVLVVFFGTVLALSALQTGDEVPAFSVVSGSGKILIREDLRDKTAVIFYEDRSRLDENQDLKDYVKGHMAGKDGVLSVIIVDCSDVGLFKRIWEDRLIDHSRKTGLPVYGDWNGRMRKSFSYGEDPLAFLVVDGDGRILYSKNGPVSSTEYAAIGEFLP
jgi:predicted transcriptional regulator